MKNDPSRLLLDRTTIMVGDVMDRLADLPDDCVDIIVTSPPYWGLRNYEDEPGQMGMEPTLGEHIEKLVLVSRELRRVLKKTGTYFLNYGDCYATSPNGRAAAETKALGNDDRTFRDKPFSTVGPIHANKRIPRGKGRWGGGNAPAGGILKPKDLCMIPNRLAIALQEDGWWVRSENVWGKLNPMPESVKDRPGVSHEKVFMLTKSAKYYFNADAVRQGRTSDEDANGFRGGSYVDGEPGPRVQTGNQKVPSGWDTTTGEGGHKFERSGRVKRTRQDEIAEAAEKAGGSSGRRMAGFNERWEKRGLTPRHEGHINHTGIDGTPRGSRALRNYEPAPLEVWRIATRPYTDAHFATFPPELVERCLLAGCPPGGVVLDPFGGAGTTSLVAAYMGFTSIMIELSEKYAALARNRLLGHVSKISTPKADVALTDDDINFFTEPQNGR